MTRTFEELVKYCEDGHFACNLPEEEQAILEAGFAAITAARSPVTGGRPSYEAESRKNDSILGDIAQGKGTWGGYGR